MGRFWTFCSKGPFSLTGALTGTALREGPLRGGFLREGWALTGSPLRGGTVLTGRAGVPYRSFTEKDDEEAYGKAGPLREAPYEEGRSLREGRVPYERAGVPHGPFTEKDDEEADGKAGPLREAPWPLRADRLTGRPLTGRLLTRRPLTNYRKGYGKLRGQTLPELGGNFRLCAVDQKRPFFPRAGPFLDLLPFKGPFSLTGALTGPPYGKAPYGGPHRKPLTRRDGPCGKGRGPARVLHREGQRRGLREGPLTGSPLRGGTVLTGRAGVLYGSFTEKDDEEAYGKAPPYELQGSYGDRLYQNWAGISACVP